MRHQIWGELACTTRDLAYAEDPRPNALPAWSHLMHQTSHGRDIIPILQMENRGSEGPSALPRVTHHLVQSLALSCQTQA